MKFTIRYVILVFSRSIGPSPSLGGPERKTPCLTTYSTQISPFCSRSWKVRGAFFHDIYIPAELIRSSGFYTTATRISRLACAIPAQTLGPVLGGKVIGCELPCLEDNSSSLNHRPPSRRAIIPFVVRRLLAGIFSLFFSRLIWLLFN